MRNPSTPLCEFPFTETYHSLLWWLNFVRKRRNLNVKKGISLAKPQGEGLGSAISVLRVRLTEMEGFLKECYINETVHVIACSPRSPVGFLKTKHNKMQLKCIPSVLCRHVLEHVLEYVHITRKDNIVKGLKF